MHIKHNGKILIIFLLLLVQACSTTKSAHVACDFAEGALDNSSERHIKKDQYNIHGQKIKSSDNSDILEGLLNIFSGMINRAATPKSKDNEPCT
tara:strand:- start:342 stop:623 length:282 start_codon:yes stop_codon:yes gene_type:complete